MAYDNFQDERPPKRLALKAAIVRAGISQRQLADIIGRHEQIVSAFVQGHLNPRKFDCFRIAAALHVHPSYLFGALYCWGDWSDFADKMKIDYSSPMSTSRRFSE